jgi:hypothetical protein
VSFNLGNPGGKSLAMGGAFTAIADDATAALANPAGLGLLSSIQVGVSAKRFDDTIGLSTARSTATGSLTADYPAVSRVNSDLGNTSSAVEFAGVVVPVSSRFVAAVTYAENLRFSGDPGPDGYAYIELRDNRSGGLTRRDYLYEYREYGSVELTNRLLGFSGAYRVSERVRLGAGITLNRTTFDLLGDAGGPHRIVSTAFRSPTDVDVFSETLAVRGFGGTAVGFVAGFHVDLLPSGKLTAGGAYRWSSKTEGTLVLGGDVPTPLAGAKERTFSFAVPRDAALGLAAQPMPGLTVAAEAQWVDYAGSVGAPLPTESYVGLAGPFGVPVDPVLASPSSPKSVVVPRLGVEYVATSGDLRLAFRVGYHREPAHGVTSDLTVADSSGARFDITDPPLSQSVRTVFDGGRADDRFSGGLGVTFARGLSADVAYDLGRSSRRLALSLFYGF